MSRKCSFVLTQEQIKEIVWWGSVADSEHGLKKAGQDLLKRFESSIILPMFEVRTDICTVRVPARDEYDAGEKAAKLIHSSFPRKKSIEIMEVKSVEN